MEFFRTEYGGWVRTGQFWIALAIGILLVAITPYTTTTNVRTIAKQMASSPEAGVYDTADTYMYPAQRASEFRASVVNLFQGVGLGIVVALVIAEMHFRADWRCAVLRAAISGLNGDIK